MMTKWITAAAAASALSSAVPHSATPLHAELASETRPYVSPGSERARIVAIASEVRRLVARFADTDASAVVAPRTLDDLGVGDVALADVVLGLEARFDLDIEDRDARDWRTVGDVVGFVARRLREPRVA